MPSIKTVNMFYFVWLLIFVNLIEVSESQSYESVTNLRSTLLDASYNPDVLPLDEQSDTLNINFTTFVFMISEVDQVQGAITMGVMVKQEWFDERLTWTPGNHSGTTTISIKSEDVWTPPLTVANPVKFTMLDRSWMQVMFQNNGKATYTVGEVVSFTCSFYMKFWPFDKQVCSLHLFVYGYPSSRLTLSVPGTVVNTDYYSKNGEWYLDENSFEYVVENFFGASQIKYSFKISRLSTFYLLTVVMPVNGIGALTCLVFLLPSESGERVGYSITIMLSLAVLLTVTADELPKNSEPFPIMCLYILFDMVVCICALTIVILNLILYHRSDTIRVTRFYKTLVRISRCRLYAKKVQDGHKLNTIGVIDQNAHSATSEDKMKNIFVSSADTFVSEDFDVTTSAKPAGKMTNRNNFVSSAEPTVLNDSDVTPDADDEVTWQVVSGAIDKIMFYALVVLTYIPSIIVLIYISAASAYVTQ